MTRASGRVFPCKSVVLFSILPKPQTSRLAVICVAVSLLVSATGALHAQTPVATAPAEAPSTSTDLFVMGGSLSRQDDENNLGAIWVFRSRFREIRFPDALKLFPVLFRSHWPAVARKQSGFCGL